MSVRAAWPYGALTAICVAVYFLFPEQLALAARIATMAIFVMSLDLVVGYGGLATLGHAVFFGVGAYATGISATHLSGNPVLGLAIGAGSGAALAALAGAFLVRYHGLTFLMLSIAIAEIVLNLAKKLRAWTGGDDGLSGYSVGKIFGVFGFDLYGKVAFIYCCALLLFSFWAMRRLMNSPFGLACVGIHQNRLRMAAMGDAVQPTLQKNQIVGLDSLGFTLSAESLVMLVLGGAGTLYGAIAGTVIFMSVHHAAASINPYHWLFIIGGMLCTLVLVPRDRWAASIRQRLASRSAFHSTQGARR
jgi:branched-chain amino acid transport system permease protein